MKSIKQTYFILLLIIFSLFTQCKSSKKNSSDIRMTPENSYDNSLLSIDGETGDTYRHKRDVKFAIDNTSESTVLISNTDMLHIERKTEGGWKKVGFRPCPCESMCEPDEEKRLDAGSKLLVRWDQQETWCEDTKKGQELKSEQVETGLYRMTFRYTNADSKTYDEPRLLKYEFLIQ